MIATNRLHWLTLTAGLALGACATTSASLSDREVRRVAEDTPPSFTTESGVEPSAAACLNPLLDPRDQTRLRLVRSTRVGTRQIGDYEVPAGRYGVRDGEVLRIDCSTGEPLGIVRNS